MILAFIIYIYILFFVAWDEMLKPQDTLVCLAFTCAGGLFVQTCRVRVLWTLTSRGARYIVVLPPPSASKPLSLDLGFSGYGLSPLRIIPAVRETVKKFDRIYELQEPAWAQGRDGWDVKRSGSMIHEKACLPDEWINLQGCMNI